MLKQGFFSLSPPCTERNAFINDLSVKGCHNALANNNNAQCCLFVNITASHQSIATGLVADYAPEMGTN